MEYYGTDKKNVSAESTDRRLRGPTLDQGAESTASFAGLAACPCANQTTSLWVTRGNRTPSGLRDNA